MHKNTAVCQTCLSIDRRLRPVEKIKDLLQGLKIEVQIKGGICWECRRLLEKYFTFRSQVYAAQRILNSGLTSNLKSLTRLSYCKKFYYYSNFDPTSSNITCNEAGPILVKQDESCDKSNATEKEGETSGDSIEESLSELPKITCIESITDLIKQLEDITSPDIIELNIPVHSNSKENSSENNSTNENDIETIQNNSNSNNECNDENPVSEEPKDKNIGGIPNSNANPEHNENSENNIKDNDKETNTTQNEKEKTNNVNEIIDKAPFGSEVRENVEKNNDECVNRLDVVNQKPKPKETITVKVAYINNPNVDLQMVRVKEEPVSDHEDIVESDEQLPTEELCRTVKTEPNTSVDGSMKYEIWKKSVLLVYSRLRVHKYASRFLHPVTDAYAPAYSRIVRRPMDLNTIRKNLKSGVTRTTAEFQRDLLLMLTNALMYNSSDHCMYKMTKDLFEETKYQLDVLLAVHAHSTLPDDTPSPRPKRQRTEFKLPAIPPKKSKSTHISKDTNTVRATKAKNTSKDDKTALIEVVRANKKNKNLIEATKTKTVLDTSLLVPKSGRNSKSNTNNDFTDNVDCKTSRKHKNKDKIKQEPVKKRKYNKSIIKVEKETKDSNKDVAPCRRSTRTRTIKSFADYCDVPTEKKTKKPKPNPFSLGEHSSVVVDEFDKASESLIEALNTIETKKRGKRERKTKKENPQLCMKPIVKLEPIDMTRVKIERNENAPKKIIIVPTEDQLNEELNVAITKHDRNLTIDEANNMKRILETEILKIALGSKKLVPKFKHEPIIVDGVLKLWCEDDQTLKWLQDTIDKLYKKHGILLKKQSEIPNKVKAEILVPGFHEVGVVLKLLAAQNPWAEIGSWIVYRSEQRGESLLLIVGVPENLVHLFDPGRKLACVLGSVDVKFL